MGLMHILQQYAGQAGAAAQPATHDDFPAVAAHRDDPGIVERVGSFHAQHPVGVKAPGAAALAIAMNHMARRA